jgi:recombinational DNA repair protein RecT
MSEAAVAERKSTKEIDAELRRLAKIVEDKQRPIDERGMSLCRIFDLRRDDLLSGVDTRIDRSKLMEQVKLLARDQSDKFVGCTLSSIIRSVKIAMISGLKIDRFKGEVDFIPRWKKVQISEEKGQKSREVFVKELHADPNFRGLIHYVGNTGKMVKPPFVECVFEGEAFSFEGDADSLRIKHEKNPLNEHRAKNDPTKIICVYSRWYLKSGTVDHVMTWAQILEHRDKYSKAYHDAEHGKEYKGKHQPGRKDSFWHKEPIKAALKTLIRDAVNRDKVPVSDVDRGYLLSAERAEQGEFVDTDIVDAEFVVGCDVEEVAEQADDASNAQPLIETVADKKPSSDLGAESLDQVFDRFIELLARAKDVKAAGQAYDAFFSPDSPHKWTAAHEAAGAKAFNEHKELVRPK